jgi:tetratricopeptide (TPR) repeat protein
MKLGVATLWSYELLDRLLESAERGSEPPTGYVIIDNGGFYGRSRAEAIVRRSREVTLELVTPGRNLGVAASWNRILDLAGDEPIVISNDDVVLGERTFAEMSAALEQSLFVSGDGWALFGQRPRCTRVVGPYDENIWPAYYEDVDYHIRLTHAGITPVRPLSAPLEHIEGGTTRRPGLERWRAQCERNREYIIAKWGVDSAHATPFREPFDGDPPTGWSLRGTSGEGQPGAGECHSWARHPVEARSDSGRPTIALCMIVRDEAAVIGRCLESVRSLIDCWQICDTGSRDGTPALIGQLLADVPGELHQRPWRDFGWNRTELMALAAGCADYLLLIDADMTLVRNGVLPPLVADAYSLRHLGELEYAVPRLVRGDRRWWFEGATHEYLATDGSYTQEVLEALAIEHHGDGGHRGEKFERDVRLLEAAIERDPADARSTFYLAQTLREGGQEERAIELYRRRVELGGWDEEVFYAAYQLGVLVGHRDPDAAIPLLLEAHERRPSRAEPLYELARLSRLRRRHHSAYLFARHGARMPAPEDILFVHRGVYEWGMRFEQAVAAYWVGQYGEALELNEALLAERRMPSAYAAAAQRNRNYCLEALGRRADPRPFAVQLAELLPDLWHREIKIDVDPPWPQFNPSLAFDGDSLEMIVRTSNYRIEPDGRYHIFDGGGVRTINYRARLDRSLQIKSAGRLEDRSGGPPAFPTSIGGWEDLRLIRVGGRWLATANARDRNPEARAEVVLLEFDGLSIVSARVLKGPEEGRHEKNWMPFVRDARLHLVYSCGPTVVYECDPATGDLREVSRRPAPAFAAALRGGSAGVRVAGGWLFAVHEAFDNGPRAYLQRFILLDDEFRLAAASAPFRFGHAPIEMCLGLARDGDRLLMSYGEDDASAHLAACSLDGVLALLETCGDLEAPGMKRAPSPSGTFPSRRDGYRLAFESFGVPAEVFTDDRELFDALPLALPPGWSPRDTSPAETRFSVTRDGIITLDGAELMQIDGGSETALLALSSAMRDHVARNARAHVFVHAGVVGVGGSAIVIPGSSHTGKTTLVAELVRAGALYYSDEYAVIDAHGLIHAYPKPLSIRAPGSGHFGVPTPVPDSQIGTGRAQAALIVLTHYRSDAEWAPMALAPAQGALALLQHTVAVRTRPRHSLRAARDLAQSAQVIRSPRAEASAVTTDLLELVRGILRDRAGDQSTRTLGGNPE